MATFPKTRWGLRWRQRTKPAKRDSAAEQLRRDRLTALIVVGIMAVILAVVIAIAAIAGTLSGSDIFELWMMP